MTAPAFLPGFHPVRWRVALLAKPRRGLVRVIWREGPLAGREALLAAGSLRRES